MRLKRLLADFRVVEVLDRDGDLPGPGPWTLYRVTKSGLTTQEAARILAREAGVPPGAVAYAGLKDKDAVAGQYMTVLGGRKVELRTPDLAVRAEGPARRALRSSDNARNSFQIVLRDLRADDMRRARVNIQQVRRCGLPAYFDDQRFGCLRHGQGFVVRRLLQGDAEGALRDLLAAPSPYGAEDVERYKAGIARRWGDWDGLSRWCRGRRGTRAFEHLREHPDDFAGALRLGVSTEERTIHLFAYQSHLWNHAAALWIRDVAAAEDLGWIPTDDGALPVPRELADDALAELGAARLPLFGRGAELPEQARRLYEAVFRAEGVDPDGFLALDLPGFRPLAEDRPLLLFPSHLRAAPAAPDEIYPKRHKMLVQLELPRGQYATLVAKRLVMPAAPGEAAPRLWIGRHCLVFPDETGKMRWRVPAPSARPRRQPARQPPRGKPKARR